MRASYRTAAAVAAVLMAATMAPTVARADESGWSNPTCTTVSSDGTLSYTRTEGHEIMPATGATHVSKTQSGLVPLAKPNHLLAVDNFGRLSLSRDAGCSWVMFGALGRYVRHPQLAAAPDGSAYVWSLDGDLYVVRGTQVEELPSVSTPAGLVALAVDHADARHLRAVTDDGRVLDSADGGGSFRRIGTAALPAGGWERLNGAAIDPADLDHIVAGSTIGALVTTDGARTWRQSSGLGRDSDQVITFSVAISPLSGSIVYVMGHNLSESDPSGTGRNRHIYASTDGGRHFHVAVTRDAEVRIPNGMLLVPSASDPSILYFVWGSIFFGTHLYRYDADTGRVRWTLGGYQDIDSIAFNPRFPRVMHLGISMQSVS